MIVDYKLPRNCWPKARVIATRTAPDGQVRSVTVQTASGGIYERSAVSLAVLDIGVEKNTHTDGPLRIPGGSVECAQSTTAESASPYSCGPDMHHAQTYSGDLQSSHECK